jgi:hypothetical protein
MHERPRHRLDLQSLARHDAIMPFDFISYLARIDPTQSYNVQQLTGGLVNLTVRASRASDCDASSSRFSAYSSFILKYAPPYVASIGPDAPFSTFRQVCPKQPGARLQSG